jgi:hypothetical protein
MRLWKMETTLGLIDELRCALSQRFPECLDLGLRIASAKASTMEMGHAGDHWRRYPGVLFVTDDERTGIEAAAAAAGIDLTYRSSGYWRTGGTTEGAQFLERKTRDVCRRRLSREG